MIIEFELDPRTNHVRLPVYINRQGPFSFTLDTGATATTLSSSLTEKLEIEVRDDTEGRFSAVKIPYKITNIERMSIGDKELGAEEVMVVDFSKKFGSYGATLDGNIGYTTLRNHILTVHYPSRLLTLEDQSDERDEILWSDFSYIQDTHLVGAPVFINGKGPFEFIVDTGAGGSIVTPEFAANLTLPLVSTEIIVRGLGGDSQAHQTTLSNVTIGSTTIDELKALVVDPKGVSPRGSLIQNGILGYPCLRNFELKIDYPKQRIAFVEQSK